MIIVGLCGGNGSGKGTVARLFSFHGIPSIDTDSVYHTLTSEATPCLDALVKEFGSGILNDAGGLDRKKMSEIVFFGKDAQIKRQTLNRIAHKFVKKRTKELLDGYKKLNVPAVLIDAPLLFESGFNEMCDRIIAVVADEEVRTSRIMARDGITLSAATVRIKSQLPSEYLIANSDYVINNTGKIADTKSAVADIAKKILNY